MRKSELKILKRQKEVKYKRDRIRERKRIDKDREEEKIFIVIQTDRMMKKN
jgi:hypothetical protein